LKLIAGLVRPDEGEIFFEKKPVHDAVFEKLVPGHPGIAYLSQHFELPKFLRVEQVLEYANTLSAEEANTLFEVCQIHHLLKRKTDQLSGGEKQRIAMARLLISSPRLLLLDEPFSHLDLPHKNTLKDVIRDIGEKLKITCILVSHDPDDVLPWADKIIVLKNGTIVQQGTPDKIYREPVNEYVAGLFGKYNVIPPGKANLFPGLKSKNKKAMLIRPENFVLVGPQKKGTAGKIKKISFLGGFAEAEIDVNGHLITVRVLGNHMKEGKSVRVAVQ
jgi:ABC-type sulfate/molybdate transport systems ATPase subunit